MCCTFFAEMLGGSGRVITLLTFFIHFINPFFAVVNYCTWVMYQKPLLGDSLVVTYFAITVVAIFFYLFIASVFYMWAWRFPDPEEMSKRRRVYGVLVNLIFSDVPLFIVGTKIVWEFQFLSVMQGLSFVISCISFSYSAVRVWIFVMIKLIKVRAPAAGAFPQLPGSLPEYGDTKQWLGQTVPPCDGNFAPRAGSQLVDGNTDERQKNSGSMPVLRHTPGGDVYQQGIPYTDGRYGGDGFSPPGRSSWPRI